MKKIILLVALLTSMSTTIYAADAVGDGQATPAPVNPASTGMNLQPNASDAQPKASGSEGCGCAHKPDPMTATGPAKDVRGTGPSAPPATAN